MPAKKSTKPVAKKTTAKAVAPKKAETGKPTAKKTAGKKVSLTAEKRYQMIRDAAYFLAEKDGFRAGHELRYWVEAEDIIAQQIGE